MRVQQLHVVLGTGPLGMATAEALVQRGHQVRMVNRSGTAAASASVSVMRADLYDPAAVRELSTGATAVYQCAQPAYHEWTTKFEPLQSAIIEGVAGSGAKLIVAENLYMYGAVEGPIHEGLPYNGHTRKGRVRARMATQLLEAHHNGILRAASARSSDFFGPAVHDSSLGSLVFGPALAGKRAQAFGQLDLPHSYTYIADFGEALATLGERDEALGQAWHVPTAAPKTQRELLAMIYAELGQPPRSMAVGRLMMTLVGLFNIGARESVEMMYEFERPFVVDSSRFERTFGVSPTPLAESIRRTVAWYRAQTVAQPAAVASTH